MNEPQVFTNPGFSSVRALEIDGEPWFVGKDVADALGYSNPRDAIARHVDDEDRADVGIHDGSQMRQMTIINESGLYSLVLSSKLPTAKQFKRWITSEVIPSIRRTGQYAQPDAQTASPADYIQAASIVAGCIDKRLPIVVDLLRRAGLEISDDIIQNSGRRRKSAKAEADIADQIAACDLIRTAVEQYGFTQREITRLIGADHSDISRYISGIQRPYPRRARLILSVVADALAAKQA